MPYTGQAGSADQRAATQAAQTPGQQFSNWVSTPAGAAYAQALYNNSQSVNNQGVPGYDPTTGQPLGIYGVTQNMATNPSTAGTAAIFSGQLPGIAQSGLSMAQLFGQIGLEVPTASTQLAGQGLNTLYALESAGIGQQQNTLQQQGLAAQLGLAGTQQGLEEQAFGLQMGQYPEQQRQAALANANAVRQLTDQGAISNTLGTEGHRRALANQAAQYGFQTEDIARAQALAENQQQGQLAQYQYNVGDLARAQQNLELTAQANGISVDQLLAQYQQGAQQTGAQTAANLAQEYPQLLNQISGGVQQVGAGAGQAGLLTPSQIMNNGMAGGVNLSNLFVGAL